MEAEGSDRRFQTWTLVIRLVVSWAQHQHLQSPDSARRLQRTFKLLKVELHKGW